MNREEFGSFFKYISAATTETNSSPERRQVYFDALSDISYPIAMIAAKKIIATTEEPFLPMPGTFRKAAIEVMNGPAMTDAEAYEEVLRLIRKHSSYDEIGAMEAMKSNQRLYKTVRAIGWRNLCLSEEPDVIRGQFRKAYNSIDERETEIEKTPDKLKEMISNVLPDMPKLGVQNRKSLRGNVQDGD